MGTARIRPVRARKRRFSLTASAVHQIEQMLKHRYKNRGKRIPPPSTLRRMARRLYRKHFA